MKKYSLNRIDTHTHTYYSFDCAENGNSPDKMCEAAIQKGLAAIILTDHIEINSVAERLYPPLYHSARKRECLEAKEKYKGKLDVYVGIELGQITHYPGLAEEIVGEQGFDYVIGSVHSTKGEPDPYYLDFTKIPLDRAIYMLDKYFDEYLQMTEIPYVDQCAHLTYPIRYMKKAGMPIDVSRWDGIIKQILESEIKHGKTYELNTVYVRKGIDLPEDWILKTYKSLGGRKIRLGSDAHYTEHVASGFDTAYDMINEIYKGE